MNKQVSLNCKIVLAKSHPNNEAEIFAIGEIPATLADLHMRIQKTCLGRLPSKYDIYYEDLSDNLHLVSSEPDYKALVRAHPADKSRTIRFHVHEAFEKLGDSLSELEKQLGGMASYGESDKKQPLKKLEDIDMTVSVMTNQLPTSRTTANTGSQGIPGMNTNINSGMNIPNKKEQPIIPQKNWNENLNLEPAVRKNDQSNPIIGQKNENALHNPANVVGQHKEQKVFEEQKGIQDIKSPDQQLNLDRLNLTKEQKEGVIEFFDQRFHEFEKRLEAKYETMLEMRIAQLNEHWTRRFDGLQAAVYQQKIPEKQPINKPLEDPNIGEEPKINNIPQKKADELSGQRPNHQAEICSICRNSIVNGIKYECLTCASYKLCEMCYKNTGHPHRVVKIEGFVPIEKKAFDVNILGDVKVRHSFPSPYYEVAFLAQNTGTIAWPGTVFVECLTGFHLGEKKPVRVIQSGKQENMVLQLEAPTEPGTYTSFWRFGYTDSKTQKKEFFGPKFAIEARIGQPEEKKPVQIELNEPGKLSFFTSLVNYFSYRTRCE